VAARDAARDAAPRRQENARRSHGFCPRQRDEASDFAEDVASAESLGATATSASAQLESLITALHRIAACPAIDQQGEHFEDVLIRLLQAVTHHTDAVACAVDVEAPDYPRLSLKVSRGQHRAHDNELVRDIQQAAARLAVARGQAVVLASPMGAAPSGRTQAETPPLIGAILSVPLKAGGRIAGAFTAYFPADTPLRDAELSFYEVVAAYLGMHVEHGRILRHAAGGYKRTVVLLADALEARDPYTRGHSQRVANTARDVAKLLKLPESDQETLHEVGQLHDLGKVRIDPEVLNKTGPLSAEERALIQKHPLEGERILAPLKWLKSELRLIRSHHERLDGTGYPDGISGDQLSMLVQVLSVADAYDAMTSQRAYRPAHSEQRALAELRAHRGTQFGPDAVAGLLALLKGQRGS
jgi:HD-GYP domain-containing protein (c-di-GMP phosphodiesterase class II)